MPGCSMLRSSSAPCAIAANAITQAHAKPTLPTSESELKQYNIRNLVVEQVRGDPRALSDMRRLIDVRRYKAAIVVCGEHWGSG